MNEILGMNEEPGSTYSSHITSARWCFYKHNAVLFVLICNTKFCSYNINPESSLDVIIPQLSWLLQLNSDPSCNLILAFVKLEISE